MTLNSWLRILDSILRYVEIRQQTKRARRLHKGQRAIAAMTETFESRRMFSFTGVAPVGFETLVNSYSANTQASQKVAMDPAGNYVVTWVSSLQDGSDAGIYAQRYTADGTPQGGEFRVNVTTTGRQNAPDIAMDSVGNFVIVWDSPDIDSTGIYGRRFNASGTALGGEFLVDTASTGIQTNPSVAMDASGAFVVVWEDFAPGDDGDEIEAQRYQSSGAPVGSAIHVNTYTTHAQFAPSVTMDQAGDFVVAWTSNEDSSGYGIYAQRFLASGSRSGAEFRVNTYTFSDQSQPSVSMDATGDFVVTWVSVAQNAGSYGIYAQRFDSTGAAQGVEFQVSTYTASGQRHPRVQMDSAGDFVVVWDGIGEDAAGDGVYARVFNVAGASLGNEFQVNTFTTADQLLPAVAIDAAGDFVVAWESSAQDFDLYGVYSQRYVLTIGPIATDVLAQTSSRVIQSGDILSSSEQSLSVVFSDNLNSVTAGPNSVTNPQNWQLTRWGVDVSYEISSVVFGFSSSLNRYIATLTFAHPLVDGGYQLIALPRIHDLLGRSLDGEADKVPGGDFRRNFDIGETIPVSNSESLINTYTTGQQMAPSTAMDANGDYVVVWSEVGQGDADGVFAQRYNSAGVAQGTQFQVNTYTTSTQTAPKVAMDAAGNFVVTWQSYGEDGNSWGVYARRYNSSGTARGGEIPVATYTTSSQATPTIAMDSRGDFVIAWASYGEDLSGYGIYAQCFLAAGTKTGSEFRVNPTTAGAQQHPAVAMSDIGNFVVAFVDSALDGSGDGVYAKEFDFAGNSLTGEFHVNTYTTQGQDAPAVAMNSKGDFVVTWQSNGQDGSLNGIFGQMFDRNATRIAGEFQVNSTTVLSQFNPSVACNATGDFVVTWESDIGGGNLNILARRYRDQTDAATPEFRLNSYTTGNQIVPSVAMDGIGDFVAVWESAGQDGDQDGIYGVRYRVDVAPVVYGMETTPASAIASQFTAVTSTLAVFDAINTNWTIATVQISSNYRSDQDTLKFTNTPKISGAWDALTGTLTLTGSDTISNYRAALRSVAYHNTSTTPNTTLVRTVKFQSFDGNLFSGIVTRDLDVSSAGASPVISGVTGTGTYFENSAAVPIATGIVVSDSDSVNLANTHVNFTNWQAEDRVTFNNIYGLQHTFSQDLTAHTAVLTITGTASVYQYQTLLRSVVYSDVSDNPNTATRTATFTVNDGFTTSNGGVRSLIVSPTNDAPVLSAVETSPLSYKANDPAYPPQAISATLLATDPDSSSFTKATIQITSGYQNNSGGHDVLGFTNQLGITGVFNAANGTLTLTGTASGGSYRTALRSVTFSTSGSAVNTTARTLTLIAFDNSSPTPLSSSPVTRNVTISTANTPPALTGVPSTALSYVRGSTAVAVAPGLLVLDSDSINLASATIQVTGNYQNGQDVLAFTAGFGVTGSFNAATGVLTLTGMTSLANYQTLLRSVTYKTNTTSASTSARTISFIVNDGLASSSAIARTVNPS